MKIRIAALLFLSASFCHGREPAGSPEVSALKGTVVSSSAALVQALGRVDLAISASRVNMRHLQGAFGEHHVSTYLNQGGEWTPMRQIVGRQGIDLIHFKMSPDGRIRDLMVSEVKTGSSRLGNTQTGLQMTHEWIAPRLRVRANQYRELSDALAKGQMTVSRAPGGLERKQMLEIPLGKGESAMFWRSDNRSEWNISAEPEQLPRVKQQSGRIAQWLDAAADGRIDYRRRIFKTTVANGKLTTIVKDASRLDAGIPESKLPVLHRVDVVCKPGSPVLRDLIKAWTGELRRTNPFMNDRAVIEMAAEHSKRSLAGNLKFEPVSLARSMAMGAGQAAAYGGLVAGALDIGMQLWNSGDVDLQQAGANALAGGTASGLGYLAGSGVSYALSNTAFGMSVSKCVASSLGMSSSCSANLLGSAAGGGVAAAVFSYGLYFLGYADLESANRMAVAGAVSSAAGAAAFAATTSLVAAYATAGTGTAISTLSGAAATSATMAAIGGGSAAAGTAIAATGVGLVVVGVGAGVMWCFTCYDESEENKRLELTGKYLLRHYEN